MLSRSACLSSRSFLRATRHPWHPLVRSISAVQPSQHDHTPTVTTQTQPVSTTTRAMSYGSPESFASQFGDEFVSHRSAVSMPLDTFPRRHVGPSEEEMKSMLGDLGLYSLETLVEKTIPPTLRLNRLLKLGGEDVRGEKEVMDEMRRIAGQNKIWRSYLGTGYSDCITPPVIQRNVLENPAWYTAYTPYQAEISQGRLECLLAFQTMICDMTGMKFANASLLDEATAAAEAMTVCFSHGREKVNTFFVSEDCHPQTIQLIKTRAGPLGVNVLVGNPYAFRPSKVNICGALLQYPTTDGNVFDYSEFVKEAHENNALVVFATDILALTIMEPPGAFGADIAVGSSQRFGTPLFCGGPHAGFFAIADEKLLRKMPGRMVGISKDSQGRPAVRLALQTREQHIRREKATSNICTAQALLANISAMYAMYHGPDGLREIGERVHHLTAILAAGLRRMGCSVHNHIFFDTLRVSHPNLSSQLILDAAAQREMNVRVLDEKCIGISLDETTTSRDIQELFEVFADGRPFQFTPDTLASEVKPPLLASVFSRSSRYLQHPVFNTCRSETEMLRYLTRLSRKDISLVDSMIPLGSCTMKLNATCELSPISWPEFANIHPFVPVDQMRGYHAVFADLRHMLAEITGFHDVSLQPNSGAQGEYAGLMVIRQYFRNIGESHRDVCLIPASAHGTNPASAKMAGFRVVTISCDARGYVDMDSLREKATKHRDQLGCLMVTYPSTFGIFEETIQGVCETIHAFGGQVYLDGANLNALCGLVRPADIGADVCHLNLHKTFCIPHGGGGPGMGPIAVAEHLTPFLPNHHSTVTGGFKGMGPISAAPWGSPAILPVTWMYLRLMGGHGLRYATQLAILNANYMRKKLASFYDVKFTSKTGFVAHEFIIDLRNFKKTANIEVEDVAKRLMDYGFHAPTISWPVPGIMMIEPTESESKDELDRFCEAMISIREEIREIEEGVMPRDNNLLKNSPHTAEVVTAEVWEHPYPRERACFPIPWIKNAKYWPPVSRIDNVYGDRHLFCSCPEPTWTADGI